VVKSPHCQHQFYTDWAARTINVDAPGATSANLRSLGHTRCRRPIFPLDDDVTFTPKAHLFRRPRYR
jgi:microcystin degradation protein MlrC